MILLQNLNVQELSQIAEEVTILADLRDLINGYESPLRKASLFINFNPAWIYLPDHSVLPWHLDCREKMILGFVTQ